MEGETEGGRRTQVRGKVLVEEAGGGRSVWGGDRTGEERLGEVRDVGQGFEGAHSRLPRFGEDTERSAVE